jgi:hypothetical protein
MERYLSGLKPEVSDPNSRDREKYSLIIYSYSTRKGRSLSPKVMKKLFSIVTPSAVSFKTPCLCHSHECVQYLHHPYVALRGDHSSADSNALCSGAPIWPWTLIATIVGTMSHLFLTLQHRLFRATGATGNNSEVLLSVELSVACCSATSAGTIGFVFLVCSDSVMLLL